MGIEPTQDSACLPRNGFEDRTPHQRCSIPMRRLYFSLGYDQAVGKCGGNNGSGAKMFGLLDCRRRWLGRGPVSCPGANGTDGADTGRQLDFGSSARAQPSFRASHKRHVRQAGSNRVGIGLANRA